MKSDRPDLISRFFRGYSADLETLWYEASMDRYTLLPLSR